MNRFIIVVFIFLNTTYFYAQKQSTSYFDFTYDCNLINSSNNYKRKSWSYEYEDNNNNIIITIDVKINPRGEDYPKELLDGMVTNLGYVKTNIGTFKKLYAAISIGEIQSYYLRKATFNAKHKMYIISVIGIDKEITYKIYKQLEETFIIK